MLTSKAVGGVTPAAIVVIAVFLSLTAVSAAMADEGSWVGNGHFRFLEDISGGYLRMRMEADLNSFEDSVSSEVNCMRDCDD
jgi:hypothetical protein